MRKGWIGIVGGLLLVCGACEQEKWEIETPAVPENTDRVPVMFTMSFEGLESGSEIVPMGGTRGTDENTVYSKVANKYKTIVAKKIEQNWIIDAVVEDTLRRDISLYSELNIKQDTEFDPLFLELRPGLYRAVTFINPRSANWNSDLKKGTVVEKGDGSVEIPRALRYWIQPDNYNAGLRMLGRELYTGMIEFEVKKTGDLSTDPYTNRHSVILKRKVGNFRVVMKESTGKYKYGDTELTFKAAMVATGGNYFPEGLDVWGNAWYDKENLCDSVRVCMCCRYPAGRQDYSVSSWTGVTVFSPFYIADEKKGAIEFEVKDIFISGQSGEHYQNFLFQEEPLIKRKLQASYITGVVLQPSDDWYPPIPPSTYRGVYLKLVDEDPAVLFGPYMDWNNKY